MPDVRVFIIMIVIFLIVVKTALSISNHYPGDSMMPALAYILGIILMGGSWYLLKNAMDWYDKKKNK